MSNTRQTRSRAEKEQALLISEAHTRDPNYGQAHLLDQIQAYYKSMITHGAIDAEKSANIRKGSCRAFSFLHGFIDIRNEGPWWQRMLTIVKDWDGSVDTLDQLIDTKRNPYVGELAISGDLDAYIATPNLIHTGVGFPRKITRRQAFAIVEHNVMLAQSGRQSLAGGLEEAANYRIGCELSYRDHDGEHEPFGAGHYVVGNFNAQRLIQMISHPAFMHALKESVCLIYSNDHACQLSYNTRTKHWQFFNPNFTAGKAHHAGKDENEFEKLFCELDASLGTEVLGKPFEALKKASIDLSFELVKGPHEFDVNPFQGYYECLVSNPFDLITFNHRKKHGKETNFADEFYICDEGLRNTLVEYIERYQVSNDGQARKALSPPQQAALRRLMLAAIDHKDITWFKALVSVCYNSKLLGGSFCEDIKTIINRMKISRDAFHGAKSVETQAISAINARKKALKKMPLQVSTCQNTMFVTPAPAPGSRSVKRRYAESEDALDQVKRSNT